MASRNNSSFNITPAAVGAETNVPAYLALAMRLRDSRKVINTLLPQDVSGDSAWAIMLELFIARLTGKVLCVKDLMLSTDDTSTTSLRRIDRLQAHGLVRRRLDRTDHRRVRVFLTDKGHTAMVLMCETMLDLGNQAGEPSAPKSFKPQASAPLE